jgi:hypothetical protein
MSEHGFGVPSVRLVRLLSLPTAYKPLGNKAISHRKLGSVGKAAFPLQLVGLMDYAIEVSTVDPRWPPCCDIN